MHCEYDENEYEDEEQELYNEEIEEIQEEYRRKKMMESLIGPSTSTAFHILLIIILALVLTEKFVEEKSDIAVKIVQDDIVDIPPEPKEPKVEPEIKMTPLEVKAPQAQPVDNPQSIEDVNEETPETQDPIDNDAVSEVILSNSPTFMHNRTGGDTPGGIRGVIGNQGGDPETYGSFIKALEWLAKVQNPNGSWGSSAQSAYTGLALLTFLAHGETNTSKRYGRTVRMAMEWLVNDPIEVKSHHGYPHAIKTYALAEAYAMTGISSIEERMNECVRILIQGQQEGGAYDYNYKKSDRQDLSFSGWNFQALKAAYLCDCDEPGLMDAIYKAKDWLKKMGASSKSFAYTVKNNDPSTANGGGRWTMRSVGTLCMQLFGEGKDVSIADELESIVKKDLPNFNYNKPPKRSLYGWYYATNAMYQAQGKHWRMWKGRFEKELNANQHKEGYWVYPGNVKIPGDDLSRKVYATTLNALTLSVYFRYLPTTMLAKKEAKSAPTSSRESKEEELNLIE